MAAPVDMLRGGNVARLTEIAKFAIGSKEATGDERAEISVGAGRIGMIDGKVVKFNTHIGERFFGPKADKNMRESCNQLRERLIEITSGMNVSKKTLDAIRRKLGLKEDGRSLADAPLLSRKDVASVINMINDDKGIDIWSNLRIADVEAIASKDLDTTFGTVRAEAEKGTKKGIETVLDVRGLMGEDGTKNILNNLVKNATLYIKDGAKYPPFDLTCRDMHRGTVVKLGDCILDSQIFADSDTPTEKNRQDTGDAFREYFGGDADFADFASRVANQLAHTSIEGAFSKSIEPRHLGQRADLQQTVSLSRQEDGSFLMTTDVAYCPETITKDTSDPQSPKLTVNPKQSFVKLSYECKLTKLADGQEGDDVIKVGNSSFRLSVDPLKVRTDARIVAVPERPPSREPTIVKVQGKDMERYEQHGLLGTRFADSYALLLAAQVNREVANGRVNFEQVRIDVVRDTEIRFGGTEKALKTTDLMGKTTDQVSKSVGEKFARHFPGDPDFATCISCFANQTFCNAAELAEADANGMLDKDKGAPTPKWNQFGGNIAGAAGRQVIEIGAVTGNSVVIKATRVYTPQLVTRDGGSEVSMVDTKSSPVTAEFSIRVTKLGEGDASDDKNVVKVGNSRFRIEVDPCECRINAQFVAKRVQRSRPHG